MSLYLEEFTPIKVDLQRINDTNIMLKPLDDDASAMLRHVLVNAPRSFVVQCGDIRGIDEHHITSAYLSFGGTYYQRLEVPSCTDDYYGAIKICLDLTGVSKCADVALLRLLMGYGLKVDPTSTVECFQLVMTGRL